MRSATTAIFRTLFLEKVIDVTAEQTVVGPLGPGLLLELVGDHQDRRLIDHGSLAAIDVALHLGEDDTPTASGVYAKRAGDARVVTVSSMTKTRLDKRPDDLRDKRPLTSDSDKFSRVELAA